MESEFLVMLNEIFKMIRKNNNLHCTHISSSKFFCSYTGKADLFPNFRDISFLSSFKSSLILLQLNQDLSQLLVITNLLVKNLGCFIESLIEASIAAFLNISLIRLTDKLFEFRKVSLTTFGISKNEF